MIFGQKSSFAIESSMTEVYPNLSLRGLGFFVIYLNGVCYGRRTPDSTALGSAFYRVAERVERRGTHQIWIADEPDATLIAQSVRSSIYEDVPEDTLFFGLSPDEFNKLISARKVLWGPGDCDEAFDDGSFVLQFDLGGEVRLIAFKSDVDFEVHSVRDLRLNADDFYSTLAQWHRAFENEWLSARKHSDSG